MFNPRKHSLQVDDIEVDNSPPFTDRDGATKNFFVAFIRPLMDKFVLLIALMVVSVVAVLEGIALVQLIPLHEKVPYFVNVHTDEAGNRTGPVERSNRIATKFEADNANKRHYMKVWLSDVFVINQMTDTNLPKATSWTRGTATRQLEDWVKKDDVAGRRERDPTLSREIDKVTISFPSKTTALASIKLIERSRGVPKPIYKLVTLEYAQMPIEKEADEYDNGIGLAITGFTVNDDMETR